jgi:hypothetical protein
VAVLVETEQRRLRVVSDCLKNLVDRGKTIGKPITVRKTCVTQQIGDVERIQRRRGAARPAGVSRANSKKTCESRKLSLIASNTCTASSGVQAARAAEWTCDGS